MVVPVTIMVCLVVSRRLQPNMIQIIIHHCPIINNTAMKYLIAVNNEISSDTSTNQAPYDYYSDTTVLIASPSFVIDPESSIEHY